jgi:hypothetical protein
MKLVYIAAVAMAAAVAAAQTTMPAAPGGAARQGADVPLNLAQEVDGIRPLVSHLRDRLPAADPATEKEWGTARDDGTGRIYDVNEPGMLVYLPPPEKRNGVALIACR